MYSLLGTLAGSAAFNQWFFEALAYPSTVSLCGRVYLGLWVHLGRFACDDVASLPCAEGCLALLTGEAEERPHYKHDEILFARAVLLPFLQHTGNNLNAGDPRLRVWDRLARLPYFLTRVFADSCAAELLLLFENDYMYRHVQSIVLLGLKACVCSAPCDVAFHGAVPAWREEQLSFSARLLALDPQPGSIEVGVILLRASESDATCPAALARLLHKVLEVSTRTSDAAIFWKSLLLNASISLRGRGSLLELTCIFDAVLTAFSSTREHLHALRVIVVDEPIISTNMARSRVLGCFYARLLQAHVVLLDKDPAGAWRCMFPDSTSACLALAAADVGEKVMAYGTSLLPDTSLLAAIAETVRSAPDGFGSRDACLHHMLAPAVL